MTCSYAQHLLRPWVTHNRALCLNHLELAYFSLLSAACASANKLAPVFEGRFSFAVPKRLDCIKLGARATHVVAVECVQRQRKPSEAPLAALLRFMSLH